VAVVIGLASTSTPSAEPAAYDPWAEVPALTTACHDGKDPFDAKLDAALSAIQDRHYKQNDLNASDFSSAARSSVIRS
jgi:hypothetical protein